MISLEEFEDFVDIAVIITFLIVSVVVLFLVLKVKEKILVGKKGWQMIAIATLLFAIASNGHFERDFTFQVIRRSIDVVNAFLFPLGLYFIYDSFRGNKR